MNVCHNNTTLTLNITCLCYLNNSIYSSNIDMLLISVLTASGAMCEIKKEPLCFNLVKVIMVLLLELKM